MVVLRAAPAPLRRMLLPRRLADARLTRRIQIVLCHGSIRPTSSLATVTAFHAADLARSLPPSVLVLSTTLHGSKKSPTRQQWLHSESKSNSNAIQEAQTQTPGEVAYQQYLDCNAQLESAREEKERLKSEQMYLAWERANTKEKEHQNKNKKSSGVAVVRTLVKQTRKELAAKAADPETVLKDQATSFLQAAADAGHGLALVQLGNQTMDQARNVKSTTLVRKELLSSAMESYRQAGMAGAAEGWFNLGSLLWTGYPAEASTDSTSGSDSINHAAALVEADSVSAMEAFMHAVDLGDADAMYFVGVQLLDGQEHDNGNNGGKPLMRTEEQRQRYELQSGLEHIEQAAGLGHGGALYYTALLYLNGHDTLEISSCDEAEFGTRLDAAVDASDADALFLRGHCHYQGDSGYPLDYRKALGDFLLAADAGNADAAVSAGAMLHSGQHAGIARNQKQAFELYQRAGELGNVEGWRNVVACYLTGEGVPRSKETAKYIAETMLKDQDE